MRFKVEKRFWEQIIPVKTEIEEITYSCPDCEEVLLTAPLSQDVPEDKSDNDMLKGAQSQSSKV
jgi:hypothetical protein